MKIACILPTGNEIRNGTVLDLDSSEIMRQIVRHYPEAEVTRLSPLVDEEDVIFRKIEEIAARQPDLVVLIGGSGGGHRHCSTLGKDLRIPLSACTWTKRVRRKFTEKMGTYGARLYAVKRETR